jgi:hypothetical protein
MNLSQAFVSVRDLSDMAHIIRTMSKYVLHMGFRIEKSLCFVGNISGSEGATHQSRASGSTEQGPSKCNGVSHLKPQKIPWGELT